MKEDRLKPITSVVAVLALLTLCFSLVACGNPDETGNADSAGNALPKKIIMGYWESPNGELLTKETGDFKEAYPDVDIEWVEFQSGTDILTAMQSGSIDFATIGTPPVALGIANNYPFKIFYLHDVIGESEGLIVRNASGITSIEDIKGKTIAVPFGTTSHFAFLNVLKANGIKTADFTLLDMTASDLFAAWQRGDIDGAYIWESVKSQLIENDGTQLVSSADAAEVGGLTAEVGIVSNDFYSKYPEVVKKYIDVLDASVQDYRNDLAGSAKLMAGGLGLSEQETEVAMNEIIVKDKSEQKDYFGDGGELEVTLKDTADFLYDQGSIDNKIEEDVIKQALLNELYE